MKNRKSVFFLLLVLVFTIVQLTSCGKNGDQFSDDSANSTVDTTDLTDESDSGDESTDSETKDQSGSNKTNQSGGKTTSNKSNSTNKTTSKATGKTRSTKSKTNVTFPKAGKDSSAKYNVSGTITVSVDTARPTDYEALFDAFEKVYPNVTVKIDYFSHGSEDTAEEYLASRAATNTLPDVVFDEAGPLPLYISQGWVAPLDSYVKNDSEFKYIPQNLISDYTFTGKLFALPHQAHFGGIYVNVDLMDTLNLDMPSMNWTLDDFEKFLKAGTTNLYSGCEELHGIEDQFAAVYDSKLALNGYNPSTKKFDLMNGMAKSTTFMRRLREIPGLEGWSLRQNKGADGRTDYVVKFGNGNTSDRNMAWKMGKILTRLDLGTWSWVSVQTLPFEVDILPYPQVTPGRVAMHVDHCFMTSTAKNKDAAFQFLRFVTYSTEGNLARLTMYNENKNVYATQNPCYIPTQNSPDVKAAFNKLKVPNTFKYFYENIGKAYRADLWKIVPDFKSIRSQYITSASTKVTDGLAVASAVFPEAEQKVNAAMQEVWNKFEAKIKSLY